MLLCNNEMYFYPNEGGFCPGQLAWVDGGCFVCVSKTAEKFIFFEDQNGIEHKRANNQQ